MIGIVRRQADSQKAPQPVEIPQNGLANGVRLSPVPGARWLGCLGLADNVP
jgi:hypothetical protein